MKKNLGRLLLVCFLLCYMTAARADPATDGDLERARQRVTQIKRELASSNPESGDFQELGFAPGSLKVSDPQACSKYTKLFDAYEVYISTLESRLKQVSTIKKPAP